MIKDLFATLCYWISCVFHWYVNSHIFGFQAIQVLTENYRYNSVKITDLLVFYLCNMAIVIAIDIVLLIIVVNVLCWKIKDLRIVEVERYPVTAIVLEKELSGTSRFMAYCMLTSYCVTVQYDYPNGKSLKETFDDEELFYKCEEGDGVAVFLIKKRSKNGKVIKRALELPE